MFSLNNAPSQNNARNIQAGTMVGNSLFGKSRSISDQLTPNVRRKIKICVFATLTLSLFVSTVTMASLYGAQLINNQHLIDELSFERERSFLMCSCLQKSQKVETATTITLDGGVAFIRNTSLILPLETAANLCQVVENKLSSSYDSSESNLYLIAFMSMMAYALSQFFTSQEGEDEDNEEKQKEERPLEERSLLAKTMAFFTRRVTNIFNNCIGVVGFVVKSGILGPQ